MEEGKFHIPTGKEEAFHFVAYVPVHGKVYELDGLQKGPIVVGEIGSEEASAVPAWLAVARQSIQERMALYQSQGGEDGSGIKFNLMAVIEDKRIAIAAAASSDSEREVALQQEEAKRQQWNLENERRRHNYVPLCIQMLKELARMGMLPELVQQAKERVMTRRLAKQQA